MQQRAFCDLQHNIQNLCPYSSPNLYNSFAKPAAHMLSYRLKIWYNYPQYEKGGLHMVVRVYRYPEDVSFACALLIAAQVTQKPDSVLGLATGSSPIGTYQQLVKWHQEGKLDFSQAISFNLDEYAGLPESNPNSYHSFMREQLFQSINMKASYLPNGNAKDMAEEGKRYDAQIKEKGGIDLQLLGIGRNGHIGFNEPAEVFAYGTSLVDLTPSTIDANKRFFEKEEDVPRKAISMGIGTIMEAKKIVLIAMGQDKAEAVLGAVQGKVSPGMPASILQMHPNAVILCDEAAAGLL